VLGLLGPTTGGPPAILLSSTWVHQQSALQLAGLQSATAAGAAWEGEWTQRPTKREFFSIQWYQRSVIPTGLESKYESKTSPRDHDFVLINQYMQSRSNLMHTSKSVPYKLLYYLYTASSKKNLIRVPFQMLWVG
jgi:hypothetical protein